MKVPTPSQVSALIKAAQDQEIRFSARLWLSQRLPVHVGASW